MRGNNFIERSRDEVLVFLRNSIFAEEHALKDGFLQSLDPRVKIASFLLLIFQVLFAKSLAGILFFYAFCLLLALISKINLFFFLKRTWIFIPLFALFIALPAIFGAGEPIFSGQILGARFSITSQGLGGALVFLMRVVTCVSFEVLLNITTRHFELLKVLRIFKIPEIFIITLGMCYRYIYLFVGIIQDTYLAIRSRVGRRVQYRRGQELAAGNIASLWNRSVGLNEEVYKAMLSRGYRGEALAWNDFKVRGRDGLWLIVVFMAITVTAGMK